MGNIGTLELFDGYVDIPQRLRLEFGEPITPAMLIDHLRGMQGVSKTANKILELATGVPLPPVQLLIRSVELNSIESSWIYRLAFGTGKEGKKRFEEFRYRIGLKSMTPEFMVRLTWGAAIAGAAYVGFHTYKSLTDEPPSVTIHNHIDMSNFADYLGVEEQKLTQLIRQELNKSDRAQTDISRFVHPAGVESDAIYFVEPGGESHEVVAAETLKMIPKTDEIPKKSNPFKDMDGVTIEFRAVDLDRKTGWRAIVTELDGKQFSVQLSMDLQNKKIDPGVQLLADITVFYRSSESGQKPSGKIAVRKIHGPKVANLSSKDDSLSR